MLWHGVWIRERYPVPSGETLEAIMNFAWISSTSRFAAVSLALSTVGTFAWTGCGAAADTSMTCDDAGVCTTCDGYGCTASTGGVVS